MVLTSKYIEDDNGVKYAPITTPNAVRWPDGSNLNDKLSAFDAVVIEAPVNATDATLPITTLTCEAGKYYRVDVAVNTLAVTLPAMTDLTTVRTVVIYLTAGTTPAITISAADSKDVCYQDGYEIKADNTYEINALFNGAAWIVAAVKINVE
jgi:hypothetical protein